MTSYIVHWWWGGNPDEPNSTSNLSLRDIFEIQRTWKPLNADARVYGMELFKRLFHKDPNTKKYFKQIRHLDEDQLSQSVQFRAHVINFMSAINMAIINLKEPEIVIAMMNKLGESHKKLRVKEKDFETFKGVLCEFLINDLKLSKGRIGSWIRFIDFIYRHIFEKMDGN